MAASPEKAVYGSAPELKFSTEGPSNGCLQYLNLHLKNPSSLCRQYGKPTSKLQLPFNSCHSRNVKAGIVRNLVSSTLKKSCYHSTGSSLQRLFGRFGAAGYPKNYVFGQLLFLTSFTKRREDIVKPTKQRVVYPSNIEFRIVLSPLLTSTV